MRQFALPTMSLCLLIAVMVAGSHHTNSLLGWRPESAAGLPPQPCFAPGTSPEHMAEWTARLQRDMHLDYQFLGRWSRTAHQNDTGPRGTPIILTYSFVPDGLMVDGQPSQLQALMNDLFGSPEVWHGKFAEVFARWSELCGVQYMEVSDDGASWPQSRGVLGQRGDIRIGAREMDGPGGVLAYNYQPDNGDMLLDAAENWAAPGQNYILLRNIVAHEHGHGFGLAHCCPANNTKLLEPYYSSSFDGPQHDDIRGAQRNYGDRYEDNDAVSTATRFGTLPRDTTFTPLSLDALSDLDHYHFAIPAGKGFAVAAVPVGHTYLSGPQYQDGNCSPGDPVNSLDRLNLDLHLYNSSGSTQLAQSASHPAGQPEQIGPRPVSPSGDSFMVRVSGSGTNDVQLYDLVLDLYELYLPACPVNLDTAILGTPVTRIVHLVNPTAATLNVYSISTDGPFTVSPNSPQTIAAHDSLALTISYPADELGEFHGTLSINHSGPGASFACELSVVTVISWLDPLLGQNVNFGDVSLGSTGRRPAPVRAQGTIALTIQSAVVAPPFGLNQEFPVTLQPGQSVTLFPEFTPATLGTAEGVLILYHTGVDSPDTLYLRGNGIPVAADDRPDALPAAFRVHPNYPNPFNAVTQIAFDLPQPTPVSLQVFDLTGRLVREISAGTLAAGRHTLSLEAGALPSGVYLYRVTAGSFSGIGKMMLLK